LEGAFNKTTINYRITLLKKICCLSTSLICFFWKFSSLLNYMKNTDNRSIKRGLSCSSWLRCWALIYTHTLLRPEMINMGTQRPFSPNPGKEPKTWAALRLCGVESLYLLCFCLALPLGSKRDVTGNKSSSRQNSLV
jgi:hypothetical protein